MISNPASRGKQKKEVRETGGTSQELEKRIYSKIFAKDILETILYVAKNIMSLFSSISEDP